VDDVWITQEFGAGLRRLRAERGLRQDEVASGAKLSRTSIVNIERGRQGVALSTVYRLAEALGVDPCELLPQPSAPSHSAQSLTVTIGGRPDTDRRVLQQFIRQLESDEGVE